MTVMLLLVVAFSGQATAKTGTPEQAAEACPKVTLVNSFEETDAVTFCEKELPEFVDYVKNVLGGIDKICIHEITMFKITSGTSVKYYTLMKEGSPVACAEVGV